MTEVLFTRADIRARGRLVNDTVHPDLVVCLHFNAEAWGDPAKPTLVDKNHLHVLVNGCYGPDEIERDDVRFEMLLKLLDRSHAEEMAVAESHRAGAGQGDGLARLPVHGRNGAAGRDQPVHLGAQSPGQPALPVPDGLPGALRDEQPGCFRPRAGGRLRRHAEFRRGAAQEYHPRIRRCGGRRAGGVLSGCAAD